MEMKVSELRAAREKKNKELIRSLKEDPHSESLLNSCKEDVTKGRMQLRLAHECDLSSMTLSPRFAVKQGPSFVTVTSECAKLLPFPPGTKPDGQPKLRPIDDMSRRVCVYSSAMACASGFLVACRSGCNAATAPSEKLAYESIDHFLAAIMASERALGKDLAFWKASS